MRPSHPTLMVSLRGAKWVEESSTSTNFTAQTRNRLRERSSQIERRTATIPRVVPISYSLAHEPAARRRVEVADKQLHVLLQLSPPVQEVGEALHVYET